MTFNLHTFFCNRCGIGTPHEMDTEGKPHCIPCAEKRSARRSAPYQSNAHDTARHIAALDGAGNRGEQRRERP